LSLLNYLKQKNGWWKINSRAIRVEKT
jgi:hypothetical protein